MNNTNQELLEKQIPDWQKLVYQLKWDSDLTKIERTRGNAIRTIDTLGISASVQKLIIDSRLNYLEELIDLIDWYVKNGQPTNQLQDLIDGKIELKDIILMRTGNDRSHARPLSKEIDLEKLADANRPIEVLLSDNRANHSITMLQTGPYSAKALVHQIREELPDKAEIFLTEADESGDYQLVGLKQPPYIAINIQLTSTGRPIILVEQVGNLSLTITRLLNKLVKESEQIYSNQIQKQLGFGSSITATDNEKLLLEISEDEELTYIKTSNRTSQDDHITNKNGSKVNKFNRYTRKNGISLLIDTRDGDLLILKKSNGEQIVLKVLKSNEDEGGLTYLEALTTPEEYQKDPWKRKIADLIDSICKLQDMPSDWIEDLIEFENQASEKTPGYLAKYHHLTKKLIKHRSDVVRSYHERQHKKNGHALPGIDQQRDLAIISKLNEVLDTIKGFSAGGWSISSQIFNEIQENYSLSSDKKWRNLFLQLDTPSKSAELIDEIDLFSDSDKNWLEQQKREANYLPNLSSYLNALIADLPRPEQAPVFNRLKQYCYETQANYQVGKKMSFEEFQLNLVRLLKDQSKSASDLGQSEVLNSIFSQKVLLKTIYAHITGEAEDSREIYRAIIERISSLDINTKIFDVLSNSKDHLRYTTEYDQEKGLVSVKIDLASLLRTTGDSNLASLITTTGRLGKAMVRFDVTIDSLDTKTEIKKYGQFSAALLAKGISRRLEAHDGANELNQGYTTFIENVKRLIDPITTKSAGHDRLTKNEEQIADEFKHFCRQLEYAQELTMSDMEHNTITLRNLEITNPTLFFRTLLAGGYEKLADYLLCGYTSTPSIDQEHLKIIQQEQVEILKNREVFVGDIHGWGAGTQNNASIAYPVLSSQPDSKKAARVSFSWGSDLANQIELLVKEKGEEERKLVDIVADQRSGNLAESYGEIAGYIHLMQSLLLNGNPTLLNGHSMGGRIALLYQICKEGWHHNQSNKDLLTIASIAPVMSQFGTILLGIDRWINENQDLIDENRQTAYMRNTINVVRLILGRVVYLTTNDAFPSWLQKFILKVGGVAKINQMILMVMVHEIDRTRKEMHERMLELCHSFLISCTERLFATRELTKEELDIILGYLVNSFESQFHLVLFESDTVLNPEEQLKSLREYGNIVQKIADIEEYFDEVGSENDNSKFAKILELFGSHYGTGKNGNMTRTLELFLTLMMGLLTSNQENTWPYLKQALAQPDRSLQTP